MRHFVHGTDGQKYGPADLALLLEWKADGRLGPETLLEPETGGQVFAARDLPELFPEAQVRATLGKAEWGEPVEDSVLRTVVSLHRLALAVWLSGVGAILCCPLPLGIASVWCAVLAYQRGHPKGLVLIVYAVACLVGSVVLNAWLYAKMKEAGWPLP